MDENIVCLVLAVDDLWHYILPVFKFTLVGVLLWFFYNYFVRRKYPEKKNLSEKDEVKLTLLKDKNLNPAFINLLIRNTGHKAVELKTPVLVFRRGARKRRFRILTVGSSIVYPLILEKGSASVVNIELEQFYHYAPGLRKAGRVNVEMDELKGQKFKSRTIRLKW